MNRYFSFVLLAFVSMLSFNSTAQSWCSLTTPDFPFTTDDSWSKYSWSAGLYMPHQIGPAQTINAISFRLDNTDGSASYNDIRIYLRHTLVSSYPNNHYPGGTDPVAQGFSLVYSGSMSFVDIDGQVYSYTLSSPFAYDGVRNIEVLIENRGGNYSSSEPWFNRTNNAGSNVFPGKVGWGSTWSGAINTTYSNAFMNYNLAIYFGSNGTPCMAYPLAVTFKGFNSKCEGDGIYLDWSTVSEINNDYFEVEYSENGTDWKKIARVDGKGTTNVESAYSFTHRNTTNATSYYRLTQVDFDGTATLLQTIASNCRGTETISASPNPTKNGFRIQHISAGDYIEVYNALGSIVYATTSGSNYEEIDLSGQQPGLFFVSVTSGDQKQILKVVKQQ